MSKENPETLEEWEAFRFPIRERSSLDQALREQAIASGEVAEDQDEQEDGEQGGESDGQGSLALHVPEAPLVEASFLPDEEIIPVAPEALGKGLGTSLPDAPDVTAAAAELLSEPEGEPVALVSPNETPLAPPDPPSPEGPAVSSGEPQMPPETTVPSTHEARTDQGGSETPATENNPPDAVHAPPESEENSWTYDAARGILINWRIGKSLILNKMDQLAKVSRYIGEVEKNRIDRPGFEKALDQACQDIHGLSLERLLATWDASKPLAWGITLADEHLPIQRPRRRSNSR